MATYSYKAKNGPREIVGGNIEAESRAAALDALFAQGIFVLDLHETKRKRRKGSSRRTLMSVSDRSGFLSLLATYTAGGVEIVDALEAICVSAPSAAVHDAADALVKSVRQGMPFHEAASRRPELFGRVALALIVGGEKSGRLGEMLGVIAEYGEQEAAARSLLVEVLAYPLFVLSVAVCACAFMMTVAVPRFSEAFVSSGVALPVPTRILIAISGFLMHYGLGALVIFVFLLLGVVRALRVPARRLAIMQRAARLPVLGTLLLDPAVLNVYRALAAMTKGGVPLFDAVIAAAPAADMPLIEADVRIIADRIQQGYLYTEAMEKTQYMKRYFPAIIANGERIGASARAFETIADELDRSLKKRCAVYSRLLEPAIIVLVGGFIGGVVLAMALPVLTMGSLVR
jgi:general secretion pathway protein F